MIPLPNHETNNVVIIGDPAKIRTFVDEALHTVTTEELADRPDLPAKIIDFNLIKPMPEILGRMVSPHEIVATQEEADQKNAEYNASPMSKMFSDGQEKIRFVTRETVEALVAEHGAFDWYSWSVSNWGTKWSGYSHSHYELSFLDPYGDDPVYGRVDLRFETAWSQPVPIFEAIQERWGVKVYAATMDEGGFPDTYFPDKETVDDAEVLRQVRSFEFESWDKVIDEPTTLVIEEAGE